VKKPDKSIKYIKVQKVKKNCGAGHQDYIVSGKKNKGTSDLELCSVS
jgi:hypothetical protein